MAARFLAAYFVDSRDPRASVRKKASGAAYAGDPPANLLRLYNPRWGMWMMPPFPAGP